MYSGPHAPRNRTSENRSLRSNLAKDYHDEQQSYQTKAGDSAELRDLKGKVKMLVGKLAAGKKQKDQLQKANENLQKEVLEMQNNLRHMVVGFSNTSSSFPMANELTAKIAQFYKCDCLDMFFDLLAPEELTLKGVIYFYMQLFTVAMQMIDQHFEPALSKIKQIGCLSTLEGPVMNVLRKAFQTKHQSILDQISQDDKINRKAQELIDKLGLTSCDKEETIDSVSVFFKKMLEIVLECRICDPPLVMNVENIGRRVEFNTLSHDPFDGFIKAKDECYVILPEVGREGEVLVKGLVLPKDYDPTC